MRIIHEHSATISVPPADVTKKMPVFYNPAMESNRNISILLINTIGKKQMNIALPLAGSGIRAIRFLQELKKGKIKQLLVNDMKENFTKMFKKNLKLNNLNPNNITISNQDASLFLLPTNGLDYIEIDPWGSPNPFLSAAVASISREGILSITATDTAALTGTYPKATKRKYWATIQKNHLMHELGLRILIRKIQLQGIQFNKALTPILSYHKNHYFKIFFVSAFGKEKCNQLLKQHQYFLYNPKTTAFEISRFNKKEGHQFFGPLWTGNLQGKKLVKKMAKKNTFSNEQRFLDTLASERDIVGYYDIHVLGKKYKVDIPKMQHLLKKLRGTRTHFSPNGIKTEKTLKQILKVLNNL